MSVVYDGDKGLGARLDKALADPRLSTTLHASRRHMIAFRGAVEERHPDWAERVDRATARLALERAIALEPTALRWTALAGLLEGEAAGAAYAQAVELDPSLAVAALGRAAHLAPAQAIGLLAATIARAPATLDRARLQLRVGELEEARAATADASAATKVSAARSTATSAEAVRRRK